MMMEWVVPTLFCEENAAASGFSPPDRRAERGRVMNAIAQRVWHLAEPVAAEQGLELWDVEYVKEAGQWFLRVYIDKREGYVGIDDCETFSRAMDPILDREDPIPDSYVFEVSSAGAERELKRPGDFTRFLGSNVEVRLYKGVDGSKHFAGTLTGYDSESGDVTIDAAGTPRTFAGAAVAQVKVKLF